MTSFYELEVPTVWAALPERYSFSSLQTIDACPRKWQLLHSKWGEHSRFPQRQHPKAQEGMIVHEALKLLMRALGQRGLPTIGSAAFQLAIADVDFWEYFAREVDRWNTNLARHPRSGPYFFIRTSPRELANRAIRIFREQYKPTDVDVAPSPKSVRAEAESFDLLLRLQMRGTLSELEISHPDLPFHGIIDLVEIRHGEVLVIDYKTGAEKEEHKLQLQLYGVLWWRRSGVRPARLVVQYLNARKEFPSSEAELLAAERNLQERIHNARRLLADKPAEAHPGKDCRYCPVRARCEAGWRVYQASLDQPSAGTTDIELSVAVEPSANGFLAEAGGRDVDVVYESTVGQELPHIGAGDRLRLLDVDVRDEGKTVEIHAWTEVYAVRSDILGVLSKRRQPWLSQRYGPAQKPVLALVQLGSIGPSLGGTEQ
jgi:CRISPR/Cas system-associated exonuclease Cas4 (RecB family)